MKICEQLLFFMGGGEAVDSISPTKKHWTVQIYLRKTSFFRLQNGFAEQLHINIMHAISKWEIVFTVLYIQDCKKNKKYMNHLILGDIFLLSTKLWDTYFRFIAVKSKGMPATQINRLKPSRFVLPSLNSRYFCFSSSE